MSTTDFKTKHCIEMKMCRKLVSAEEFFLARRELHAKWHGIKLSSFQHRWYYLISQETWLEGTSVTGIVRNSGDPLTWYWLIDCCHVINTWCNFSHHSVALVAFMDWTLAGILVWTRSYSLQVVCFGINSLQVYMSVMSAFTGEILLGINDLGDEMNVKELCSPWKIRVVRLWMIFYLQFTTLSRNTTPTINRSHSLANQNERIHNNKIPFYEWSVLISTHCQNGNHQLQGSNLSDLRLNWMYGIRLKKRIVYFRL